MKYPIIFKGADELGLKNIYSLIENFDQCGGNEENKDSPSGTDVINKPLSADSEIFQEYCQDYDKLPHILPVVSGNELWKKDEVSFAQSWGLYLSNERELH